MKLKILEKIILKINFAIELVYFGARQGSYEKARWMCTEKERESLLEVTIWQLQLFVH